MKWLVVAFAVVMATGVAVWRVLGRALRNLAEAGAQATVEAVSPVGLPVAQFEVASAVEALGFTRVAVTMTDVPARPAERTMHLVDPPGEVLVRVMSVAGVEGEPSVTAISWFPGGRLTTSRLTSRAIDPDEVIQCVPGATCAELVETHQAALGLLAHLDLSPLPVPADLGEALQREWRRDSLLLLAATPRARLSLLGVAAAHANVLTAESAPAVAARLARPSPHPGTSDPAGT